MSMPRKVQDDRPLVTFLYLLCRDHLPMGAAEAMLDRCFSQPTLFSNPHLAEWAAGVADRLED